MVSVYRSHLQKATQESQERWIVLGGLHLPSTSSFLVALPSSLFYIISLSTEMTSALRSKSRDFCESFDPDLHINLVNPNVISILLLLILFSVQVSPFTVFFISNYTEVQDLFHRFKSNFTLGCFRKWADHLCWKSSHAAFASPALPRAHLRPEAKGPADSSVWSERVKVLSKCQKPNPTKPGI